MEWNDDEEIDAGFKAFYDALKSAQQVEDIAEIERNMETALNALGDIAKLIVYADPRDLDAHDNRYRKARARYRAFYESYSAA